MSTKAVKFCSIFTDIQIPVSLAHDRASFHLCIITSSNILIETRGKRNGTMRLTTIGLIRSAWTRGLRNSRFPCEKP